MSMRAAFYEQQGPAADVLVVGEVPPPHPGRGEVRVRLAVSGLNPSDIKSRTGFHASMQYGRVIPHQDGAGVVDEVGEDVEADRIGERVWVYEAQSGSPSGTAAEFVAVPAERAVPLPAGVSFETGASVGIPALTAHRCLFADGDVRGLRVLVHGGAGVVGRAAIMLAKWAGAWVATTVRDRADIDAAGDAGADVVINLLENDVAAVIKAATAGAGVDRIVEVDLLSNLDTDLASLAPGGVISTYAVDGVDDLASVPVFRAMRAGAAFRFVLVYTVPAPAKRAAVEDVTAWLAARGYRPRIGLTAPLDRIVEAHEALESRKVKGNILVRTQPIADFE